MFNYLLSQHFCDCIPRLYNYFIYFILLTSIECDPHCATGVCSESGGGKCDGECEGGYKLTFAKTCQSMYTNSLIIN